MLPAPGYHVLWFRRDILPQCGNSKLHPSVVNRTFYEKPKFQWTAAHFSHGLSISGFITRLCAWNSWPCPIDNAYRRKIDHRQIWQDSQRSTVAGAACTIAATMIWIPTWILGCKVAKETVLHATGIDDVELSKTTVNKKGPNITVNEYGRMVRRTTGKWLGVSSSENRSKKSGTSR